MNPITRLIEQTIRPYHFVPHEAFNKLKINAMWHDLPELQTDVALWKHFGNLYVLGNDRSRNGSFPEDYQYMDRTQYKYSWCIVHDNNNWQSVFHPRNSSAYLKYLEIIKDDTSHIISLDTVQEYRHNYSPYKNFTKINYIPHLFKEKNGSHTRH